MKVILTGASGFIGNEVLHHCLQSPRISSIIALSRRALPNTLTAANPKLKVVILEDFCTYPPSVLQELEGAQAFIWCLGLSSVADVETTRKVSIDYTVAALDAVMKAVIPGLRTRREKMRFLYLGGILNERDQERRLWFLGELRRARGLMETRLLELPQVEALEAYIVKPSVVLRTDAWVLGMIMGVVPLPSIRVDELAAAMLDIVMVGDERRVWDNAEIVERGKEVLRRGASGS